MQIVLPAAPAVNHEEPIAPRLLRRLGFDAYCDGRSYFDMPTTDERAGWMAACDAHAAADTDAYLAGRGGVE
jgi:hypothetical protein